MNKPKTWQKLPYRIKQWFISQIDFDYDIYESSLSEQIDSVLNQGCDYTSKKNLERIENAYNDLSAEELEKHIKYLLNELKNERKTYLNLLGEKTSK